MIAMATIQEESLELLEELRKTIHKMNRLEKFTETDLEAIAKEMADVLYVTYGAACQFGVPLDRVFDQVCKSNMSKLVDGKFQYRADGKVLKGPEYKKPDLSVLWNA